MEDFLLVVGEQWQEIANATLFARGIVGQAQLAEMISAQEWVNISQFLENEGLIAENSVIVDARMFDTNEGENPIRMWIRTN